MNTDSSICPLCGQDNHCTADHSCWCMDKKVPKALITQAEKHAQGPIDKRCICQNCIDQFNAQQKKP